MHHDSIIDVLGRLLSKRERRVSVTYCQVHATQTVARAGLLLALAKSIGGARVRTRKSTGGVRVRTRKILVRTSICRSDRSSGEVQVAVTPDDQ